MAIPITVDAIIDGAVAEQARIEYKESWNPEAIVHTLCAFANDIDNWGGGYIVVGVEEEDGRPKKPVKGVPSDSLDSIQKSLLRLCHSTRPLYLPACEPVRYDDKNLLLIWAPGGYERPYRAPVSVSTNTFRTLVTPWEYTSTNRSLISSPFLRFVSGSTVGRTPARALAGEVDVRRAVSARC